MGKKNAGVRKSGTRVGLEIACSIRDGGYPTQLKNRHDQRYERLQLDWCIDRWNVHDILASSL